MCYCDLCSLNVDHMWDLFKCLASYQWQYECASESFACPSLPPYDLHAQSPCADQFKNVCDDYVPYPHVCSYCQPFDHDVNYCLYYNVSNEAYARLNVMIDTMNERHEHFVNEMREFSLLYETTYP